MRLASTDRIMNTGNTTVPAIDSSLEVPSEDLYSFKSETENKEQPETFISASKLIPITSPELDAFKKAEGITSNDEFFDVAKSIPELVIQYFSETHKNKFPLLDIKELQVPRKVLKSSSSWMSKKRVKHVRMKLIVIPVDKEKIATLKSRITSYQQTGVIYEKSNPVLLKLEETLDRISRNVDEHPSADYLADVLENFRASTELVNDHKKSVKSLCEEVEVLLDSMLNHLSRLRHVGKNIGNSGIID